MFILTSSGGNYNYNKFVQNLLFPLFCHAYKIILLDFRSAFSGSPYIRPEALQMTVYSVLLSPYFKIYTLVVFALKLSTLYRKFKIVLTSSTQ